MSASRIIVGITGRIGAGKTSAARHLEANHRFKYLRYSQVLSEWLAKCPGGKQQLQVIGWEVMDGGKQSELNSRLIAQIDAQSDHVIDGLRHPIDFHSLKAAFPSSFHLLYIDCPLEVRWKRLSARFPTFDEFIRADSHPVEGNIDVLKSFADRVLTANRSMQEFTSALDQVVAAF
jgi:dephospho-CoA kinase